MTVSADYVNIVDLLNLCMNHCIPYCDMHTEKDRVSIRLRAAAYRKLKREADKRGICYSVEKLNGIPFILARRKNRYGLFVGAVCALLLIILSQQFVWDIEITGNERMTSMQVREILASHGFSVGSFIPRVNTDRIENKILIDNDGISWMSINIVGTVATVQIREYEGAATKDVALKPANLVASKSGIVEEVRIYRGNVVVGYGQFVKEGDLLVSGLYDSNQVGFRYTRASGEVLARTVSEYYIEIPYKYVAREYTGEEYCDKYLNFFDFSINIFKNSRKDDAFYDKIDMVENYCFPSGAKLPIALHTVKYLEYNEYEAQRSKEEAETLAYFELSQRLDAASENSMMIRKTVTPKVMEDRFVLHCVVVSIENIAVTSEFDVDLGADK